MSKSGDKVREKIKMILSENLPLNTCQVCRLYNGARHRNDIKFCTSGIKDKWTDETNFKKHGNFPYKNCKEHKLKLPQVWYYLGTLEKKGTVESRIEFRRDPVDMNRKDRMRMWALKGRLPSLNHFAV